MGESVDIFICNMRFMKKEVASNLIICLKRHIVK